MTRYGSIGSARSATTGGTNETNDRRWRTVGGRRVFALAVAAVALAVAIVATVSSEKLLDIMKSRGFALEERSTRLLTTRELEALLRTDTRARRFQRELEERQARGDVHVLDPWTVVADAAERTDEDARAGQKTVAELGGFFDFLTSWANKLKKLTGKLWRRYVAKYVKHIASAANTIHENANLMNVVTDISEGVGNAANFVEESATSAYYNYGNVVVRHVSAGVDGMDSIVNEVADLGEMCAKQVSAGAIEAFESASGALDELYDQTSGFLNDAVDVIEEQVDQIVDVVGDVIAMLKLLFGGLECLASQDLLFDFAKELHKAMGKDSLLSMVKNIREETKGGGLNKYLNEMDDTLCHATWVRLFPNVNLVANAFKSFAFALRDACPAIGKAGKLPAFTFGVDLGADVTSIGSVKGVSTEVGVGLDLNGRQFCYAAGCVKSHGIAVSLPGASVGAAVVLTGYKDIEAVPGRAEFLTLGFGIDIPAPLPPLDFDIALTYVYVDPSMANFAGVAISYEVGSDGSANLPVTLEISQGFCEAICIEKHGGDCGSSEGAFLGTHLHPSNSSWEPFALLGQPSPFYMDDNTAKCYLNRYADIFRKFGTDLQAAKRHFHDVGQHEGRIAHCTISDADLKCYLARYKDLPWSQPNDGRTHFFQHGWKEGRTVKCAGDVDRYKFNFNDANLMYDYDAVCYIDNYDDVRKAFGFDLTKAKNHYFVAGAAEKRKPICSREPVIDDLDAMCFASNFWDIHRYFGEYPGRVSQSTDIANIKTCMRVHHKQEARKKLSKCERVSPADFRCYLQRYPEVPRSSDDDVEAARLHWLKHGWKEGKNPKCDSRPHFYRHAMKKKHWPYISNEDAQCYLDRYPDIAKKYRHLNGQSKLDWAKIHYVTIGRRFRRDPTCAGPHEATKCYIARYDDVRQLYTQHKSLAEAAKHMRTIGVDEERETRCALSNDDLRCYMARYPALQAKFNGDTALAREYFFAEGFKNGDDPKCEPTKFYKTFTGDRTHGNLDWTLNGERGLKKCQDDCLANPKCVGISYVAGRCHTKGTASSYDVIAPPERRDQFYWRHIDGFFPDGNGDRPNGIIGKPHTKHVAGIEDCARLCRENEACVGISFHSAGLCQLKGWSGLSHDWHSNHWQFYRKLA